MKITKVHLSQEEKNITPLSSQKPTVDFSAYLRDALEQENTGVKMVKNNISAVYDDGVNDVPSYSGFSGDDANRLNSAIDQIDILSNLLISPEFNPRQVDNFVDTMLQMGTSGGDTTSSNTTLRMVEEEIRMCSFLESVKWKRGDYL